MRYPLPFKASRPPKLNAFEAVLATAGAGLAAYLAARTFIRRARWFDLRGKVAIVVGGSTGIGFALAEELIRRGAKVAICARHEKELRSAMERLGNVLISTCDITDPEQVDPFIRLVRSELGAIDVVVNCAGTIVVGPISNMQAEDFKFAMDTNFYGPLHVLLAVMPEMRRRGRGRIVNIASFGGKVPVPHMATYAASKFAFVGLSETLRTELLDDGIYVTTVCPGLVRSGSTPHALFKGRHEEEKIMFETMANTPILTISPKRLVRKIVNAMQHADAELITPWVAQVQSKLHGLLPGMTEEFITVLNALMPGRSTWPDGDQRRAGAQVDVDDRLASFVKRGQARAEAKYQHRPT